MSLPFRIKYGEGAVELTQSLFGRAVTDDEIGFLAGALDGAEVIVSVRKVGLFLDVKDAGRFETYETSIRRDADGSLWAYIHDVRTTAGLRGQGLGIRAFVRQVQAAREFGLTRFELWAAGHPGDQTHNGWLTWPKFGFDAPLNRLDLAALPRAYAGARTLNDIMRLKAHAWWAKQGSERAMIFYLRDDSSMMEQFQRYLNEKGLSL
jgi:hypothetical protein